MTEDKYAELAKPLPKEAIQKTKAAETRKGYDTTGFGYQYAVNRFNEVLGLDGWGYSYEVIHSETGTYKSGSPFHDVGVEVSIWVDRPDNVRPMPGGHIANNYIDARKGAITNGFKKAAAMWGVGRQAYEGSLDDDSLPTEEGYQDARHGTPQPARSRPVDSGGPPPITDAQKRFIRGLESGLQLTPQSTEEWTAKQASDFIGALQERKRNPEALGQQENAPISHTEAALGLQEIAIGAALNSINAATTQLAVSRALDQARKDGVAEDANVTMAAEMKRDEIGWDD